MDDISEVRDEEGVVYKLDNRVRLYYEKGEGGRL